MPDWNEIRKQVDSIQRSLERIKSDIDELRKNDNRQLVILIALVSGLLGLDITKVTLLFSNLNSGNGTYTEHIRESQ